jgi:DNA polymerase-3 subunit alpha
VEEESCKLMASEVLTLKEVQERLTRRVHLRLSSPGLDQEQLQGLKDILQRHRGGCDVRIHLVVPNRSETVMSLPPGFQVAASDQLMSDTDKLFGYHVVTFE